MDVSRSSARALLKPVCLLTSLFAAAGAHAFTDNVLLVIADDLGVDRVGAYAEHPDPGHTPVIDGLAADGVLFRNAWANPQCSPSRATILTGRYGFRTLLGRIIPPSGQGPGLDLSETTLPEVLAPTHSSFVVGKWHLANQEQGAFHPLDSGFAHHSGTPANIGWVAPRENYSRFFKWVDGLTVRATKYATTDTVDDALDYLGDATEPWFLMVAFNAPHKPLHAPPDHLHTYDLSGPPTQSKVEHYKAAIEALDTELGRLLEAVDRSSTTILFVGDNGTFGRATDAPLDPNRAKGTVFEGGINVPLIVAGSNVSTPGSECAALVNTTDIFATVAELAGAQSTAEDSVSLVPYLKDPARPSIRETVFAEIFGPNGPGPYGIYHRAMRGPRYKLIERDGRDDLFYDLSEDPFERDDLPSHPALTANESVSYVRLKISMANLLDS